MNDATHDALFSHPLFAELSPLDNAMLQSIKPKRLEKNEVLYRPGLEARFAYLIVKGAIKFDFALNSGKEVFVEMVNEGFVIGELEILSGFDYQSTAIANEVTEVLLIPKEVLLALIEQQPQFALKFTRQLATNFYFFQLIAAERESSNLKAKLANLLMSLALRFGRKEQGHIVLNVSHGELSDMLNASRQRVNQHLSVWQKEGVIACQYGTITILDIDQLSAGSGLANSFISEENARPYQ